MASQNTNQTAQQITSKNDFSDVPESNDVDKIRKQLEYYLSDTNLPRDRYLFGLTGGCANIPVPLKTIHDFQRMKRFQPYSAVVAAAKSSKLLKINEKEEISRVTPLEERFKYYDDNDRVLNQEERNRTMYVSGFPEELDKKALTHIEAWVDENLGMYNPIRTHCMRYSGRFDGKVCIVFATEDALRNILGYSPKGTRTFKFTYDGKTYDVDGEYKSQLDNRINKRGIKKSNRDKRRNHDDKRRHDGDRKYNNTRHHNDTRHYNKHPRDDSSEDDESGDTRPHKRAHVDRYASGERVGSTTEAAREDRPKEEQSEVAGAVEGASVEPREDKERVGCTTEAAREDRPQKEPAEVAGAVEGGSGEAREDGEQQAN